MTEENKDSLIEDLKSDRERLLKRCRKLELEYDDLQNAFDESCEHRQLLFTRYADAYSEGFKKGEQSMQEKVDKIIDYWVNNPSILTQWFGGETTLFQLLEKTKQTCERIEYETEKEQEIHVGDEVVDEEGYKYVVKRLDGKRIYVLASNGVPDMYESSGVSKTGKHYDLDEILKELE